MKPELLPHYQQITALLDKIEQCEHPDELLFHLAVTGALCSIAAGDENRYKAIIGEYMIARRRGDTEKRTMICLDMTEFITRSPNGRAIASLMDTIAMGTCPAEGIIIAAMAAAAFAVQKAERSILGLILLPYVLAMDIDDESDPGSADNLQPPPGNSAQYN